MHRSMPTSLSCDVTIRAHQRHSYSLTRPSRTCARFPSWISFFAQCFLRCFLPNTGCSKRLSSGYLLLRRSHYSKQSKDPSLLVPYGEDMASSGTCALWLGVCGGTWRPAAMLVFTSLMPFNPRPSRPWRAAWAAVARLRVSTTRLLLARPGYPASPTFAALACSRESAFLRRLVRHGFIGPSAPSATGSLHGLYLQLYCDLLKHATLLRAWLNVCRLCCHLSPMLSPLVAGTGLVAGTAATSLLSSGSRRYSRRYPRLADWCRLGHLSPMLSPLVAGTGLIAGTAAASLLSSGSRRYSRRYPRLADWCRLGRQRLSAVLSPVA